MHTVKFIYSDGEKENMKKDLLVILNPRQHQPSIESLKSLNIPKVWITGMHEGDALEEVNNIVKKTDYENYIMQSDDVIVNQEQIDAITENNKDYDILSGWCKLNPKVDNVNVCPAEWGQKLKLTGKSPIKSDYPFYGKRYTYDNIMETIDTDIFETYSIGFSFTSFKRNVLLEYPLKPYNYKKKFIASDHNISYRIVEDGKYKMYVHKNAFFEHLKLKSGRNRSLFKVGKKFRKTTWEI